MNVIPTSPAPCGALRSHSAAARASPLPTPPPRGGSETAAARSRTARGGARMRGLCPLKLPLGWHMAHGTQWGESCHSKDSPHPVPEVFVAVTQARKGSMEQSVHRPLSQSVFWLDRRVNSAIRERGRLDLLRRPRAPVVTDCCIDPPARTCGAGSRRPRKHPACSSPSYRCFPSQFLVENAFRADIPDYL